MKKNKYLFKIIAFLCLIICCFGCGADKNDSSIENEENIQEVESIESEESAEATDDIQTVALTKTHEKAEEEIKQEVQEPEAISVTICFAGDINLAEEYGTTDLIDSSENGIFDCIDEEMISVMKSADLMILNNEFTYSDQGAPLEGKAYTFRADPKRVDVLKQVGVDAVNLANNHVYDYGQVAMLDTFATLEAAGIDYFGAGVNIERAMKPLYVDFDNLRVSFVSASRAEKIKMTPQATEDTPGILRCYDTALFDRAISEAKANSDICIAVVHWGTEYSTELEAVQIETAKEYVAAGADIIIGAHSHCLQGLEFVDDAPVLYSLGNYWFNGKTLDTMLASINISEKSPASDEYDIDVQLIPGVQEDWHTRSTYDSGEARRIFDDLEKISIGIEIDDDGWVRKSE